MTHHIFLGMGELKQQFVSCESVSKELKCELSTRITCSFFLISGTITRKCERSFMQNVEDEEILIDAEDQSNLSS